MISILNYGAGNLASIQNMLKKIGADSCIISTPDEVKQAVALIIPGVGRIDFAVRQIDALGLRSELNQAALIRKIPVLGVCLGMQLMTNRSEEGNLPTLGWIDAVTLKIINKGDVLRVPHMGWNTVRIRKAHPIFDGTIGEEHRFYFVHSYAVQCHDSTDVLATTRYGEEFVSAFSRENIIGVQFHPEKSHRFGKELFSRFVRYVEDANE